MNSHQVTRTLTRPSNSELCEECFYCRRGQILLCENFNAHGVTMDGGFAEYCAYPAGKVFKIQNLSDVDATLLEPASCAAHGLDKISPKLGSSVLMFGAGPTGLVLSQMLRHNGGCNVVVAAPEGLKMDLAKKLGAGDVSPFDGAWLKKSRCWWWQQSYVALSRENPEAQFEQIKKDHPYGFDSKSEMALALKALGTILASITTQSNANNNLSNSRCWSYRLPKDSRGCYQLRQTRVCSPPLFHLTSEDILTICIGAN